MAKKTSLVEAFDASDAAAQIRDRLRLAFIEAIPPEKFDELIKAEFARFVTPKRGRDRGFGSTSGGLSELQAIVKEVLADLFREKVKAELAKPEWDQGWDHVTSEAVKAELKNNATEYVGLMLQHFIGSSVQAVVEQMKRESGC